MSSVADASSAAFARRSRIELLENLSTDIVCRLDEALLISYHASRLTEIRRRDCLCRSLRQMAPLLGEIATLVEAAAKLSREYETSCADGIEIRSKLVASFLASAKTQPPTTALKNNGRFPAEYVSMTRDLPASEQLSAFLPDDAGGFRSHTKPPWDGRLATIWPDFVDSKLTTGEYQESRRPELKATIRIVTWLMGADFSLYASEDDFAELKRRYLSLPKDYKTMRTGRQSGSRCKSYDELMEDVRNLRRSGLTIPVVKPVTFNKHKSTLSSCLEWAKGHRRSQLPIVNRLKPLHIKVKKSSRAAKLERSMTPNAFLVALFTTPVWHGRLGLYHLCRPGPLVVRDSLYWVPLMMAGNGLRREEACQLRVRHVIKRFGIWCYDLLAEDIKVKTPEGASPRLVPIQKEVLAAGFLETLVFKRASESLLFPELSNNNAHGSFGVSYGKRIANYVANVPLNIDFLDHELISSLPAEAIDPKRLIEDQKSALIAEFRAKFSNHGIRHWWKTYAINNGCHPDFVDDNLGHMGEVRGEGRRYLKEIWVQNVKSAVDMVPMPFDGISLRFLADRSEAFAKMQKSKRGHV